MLFNSLEFCLFFLVVWSLYWISPFRVQNLVLLAASYLFYSFWDWRFLSLILISTIVDSVAGLKIAGIQEGSAPPGGRRRGRRWLMASIFCNLGILALFKYFNFFVGSLEAMMAAAGIDAGMFRLNIILPVGISFYTFQTMSYTIDIYRGTQRPTRNILDFALFVAFFPQLVAGPIERAKRLLPQITHKRRFDGRQLSDGLRLILLGYFKKVYVADNLALVVDQAFSASSPGAWQVLTGAYAFTIQIYCDFSGYTDIARGCSKCLGIELMPNFNYPFLAVNPSEFWKRWHISLSTWLRDYLYIPLGGNRRGAVRTNINLALTMLLGGLWHGASWNMIIWGAWHGALLIGYHQLQPFLGPLTVDRKSVPGRFRRLPGILVMFNLVALGFVLFRSPSLGHSGAMLASLFNWYSPAGIVPAELFAPLFTFGLPLFVVEFILHRLEKENVRRKHVLSGVVRCITYSVIFYLIVFFGAVTQSFIYFQF